MKNFPDFSEKPQFSVLTLPFFVQSQKYEEDPIMTDENKTIALTPRMLAARLNIGRDKAYALMKSAGFPSIQIGDRYIITEDALTRWLHEAEGRHYSIDDGRFKK